VVAFFCVQALNSPAMTTIVSTRTINSILF
jgi:hypothetical protein